MESGNGAIAKCNAIDESDELIVKINGADAMRR
jgi:hypothetical protein